MLNITGVSPFEFDKETRQLIKRPFPSNPQRAKILGLFLIACTLFSQMIYFRNSYPVSVVLETLIYLIGAIIVVICPYHMWIHQNAIVELYNLLLQFENQEEYKTKFQESLRKWETKVLQLIQLIAITTAPTVINLYAIAQWLNPCQPALFLFFTLEECKVLSQPNWKPSSILQLTLLDIFSIWSLWDLSGGCVFLLVPVAFVICFCIRYYNRVFGRILQGTTCTEENLRFYYKLRILHRHFSKVQEGFIIAALLFVANAYVILGFYMLITFGWSLPLPKIVFFMFCEVDCLLIIIIYCGVFGGLHSETEETLLLFRKRFMPSLQGKNRKLKDRLVKSFQPLKVAIGVSNYVDKLTPLVMIQFCIDQMVSLLLVN
ncbi:unnamed protein product [Orchesella dallaii]|uniref:Odorant receptor n=1 Tax=Orchesella dallaii TaxID=48710 RepID=A0ABP1S939_9HEXA